MDLDATVGGPAANSYVTLAAANDYLSMRLGTAVWFEQAATMAQRPQALMWATSLLDTFVHWHGQPATTTQALAWPQTGQVTRAGQVIASDIIPADIQEATSVYALLLLQEQAVLTSGTSASLLVKSRKIGDTTITYQDVTQASTGRVVSPQRTVPGEVRALVQPYGVVAGGLTVSLLRT